MGGILLGPEHLTPQNDPESKTMNNLPAELITDIVEYLAPTHIPSSSLTLCELVQRDVPHDALRFRNVCRTFYQNAWRAFGQLLNFTTFDIRSRKSMRYLQRLCHNPNVYRYVTELTFGCGRISTSKLLDLVALTKSAHEVKSPDFQASDWVKRSEESINIYREKLHANIIKKLASSLSRLPHLQKVTYRDTYISSNYSMLLPVLRMVPPEELLNTEHIFHDNVSVVSDLAYLFTALQKSDTVIKKLTLPAPINWQSHITAFAKPGVLQHVFYGTESLRLIEQRGVEPKLQDRLDLNRNDVSWNTSKVQSLKLHRYLIRKGSWLTPRGIQQYFPALTDITFHECVVEREHCLHFLKRFRSTLRSVIFRNTVVMPWEIVLFDLKECFNLDYFEINITIPKMYENYYGRFNLIIPARLLYATAKTAVLSPERYFRAVYECWDEQDGSTDTITSFNP